MNVTKKLHNTDKLETSSSITFSVALIAQTSGVASGDQIQRGDSFIQPTQTIGGSTPGTNAIPSTLAPADTTATLQSSVDATSVTELQRNKALESAREGIANTHPAPPAMERLNQVISSSSDAVDGLSSFSDTWGVLLEKLKVFVEVTDQLAEVRLRMRSRQIFRLISRMKDPPLR